MTGATTAVSARSIPKENIGEHIATGALAVLDKAGHAVDLAESVIDTSGDLAGACITVPVQIASNLLPQGAAIPLNKVVGKTVSLAENLTTSVAKAALNGITFGAPAWLQAARQYAAVSGGASLADIEKVCKKSLVRDDLALKAAEKIISRVENYYKDRVGSWGGMVHTSSLPGAREALKNNIASKLSSIMEKDLSREEMAEELKGITRGLRSAFLVNQHATRATLYTALGVAAATGALHTAWNYLSNAASSTMAWLYDSTIGAGIRFVHEFVGAALDGALDLVKAPFRAIGNGIRAIGEGIGNIFHNATKPFIPDLSGLKPPPTPIETVKEAVIQAIPEPIKNIPLPSVTTPELSIPNVPAAPSFSLPVPVMDAPYVSPANAGGAGSILSEAGRAVSAPFEAARGVGQGISSGVSTVKSAAEFVKGIFSWGGMLAR